MVRDGPKKVIKDHGMVPIKSAPKPTAEQMRELQAEAKALREKVEKLTKPRRPNNSFAKAPPPPKPKSAADALAVASLKANQAYRDAVIKAQWRSKAAKASADQEARVIGQARAEATVQIAQSRADLISASMRANGDLTSSTLASLADPSKSAIGGLGGGAMIAIEPEQVDERSRIDYSRARAKARADAKIAHDAARAKIASAAAITKMAVDAANNQLAVAAMRAVAAEEIAMQLSQLRAEQGKAKS